ncbi:MAG: phospholipase D-like domain-containing protein [Chthoniobacterales bacterium]
MIVVSPTDRWLKAALEDCSSSLAVSSPYVGRYLNSVVSRLDEKISVTLLTRTLLSDFASNASDFEAVHALAVRSGGVLSLSSLHAKVYIVDQKRALITSANATFSGMYRNRECGAEIKNRRSIGALRDFIQSGFGSSPTPQRWTAHDLNELREPIELLRGALSQADALRRAAVEAPPRVRLQRRQLARLVETFSGWLQLTFEGILEISSATFTMNEVFAACAPLARSQFPENRHVREKLRQQMQRLRDLGLVLFLGRGRYERLLV